MKKIFSVLAMVFMVVIATPQVEAKKFGGGKSFGKSYKTAPANKSNPTNTNSINKQNTGKQQPATAGKKSMLGGLFGGLLAGGLLAALFAGGAFEGFQFFDFILIGLFAFIIYKLVQMMRAKKLRPATRQAYAGPANFEHRQQRPSTPAGGFSSTAGFGHNDVPFNYPANFDVAAFLQGAREHYRILQQAWNTNALDTIKEYVSEEMYHSLVQERAAQGGEQHTEVMYVDAQIVRADCNNQLAQLSVQFSGRYRDSHEGVEEDIKDIWHLERDLLRHNAPWLIVGIEG